MDLYTSYFNGEEWTGVISVGTNINTKQNEVFPFLLNDSLLIFASDRPNGKGGLDMYVSIMNHGVWKPAELLPDPFNSPYDDLGLIVRENMKSGYFASNRPGGKGKDDLYRFDSESVIFGKDLSQMVVSGIQVLDKLSLEGISEAEITLTPLDIDINNFAMSSYNIDMLTGKDPGEMVLKLTPKKGQTFPSFFTDTNGKAIFQTKHHQKYLLKIQAKEYTPLTMIYDYTSFGADFNIVLEPEEVDWKEDDDNIETDQTDGGQIQQQKGSTLDSILTNSGIGDVFIFENIYFDYNSSNLQTGATQELHALVRTIQTKTNLNVRLESHTDSRGQSAYNLQLSINRANAIRSYLTDHGVDEDRITIRGYGESRLRNQCKDNIPCTDAEHRYNRRTEVVIEAN